MGKGIGDSFQEETKYRRGRLPGGSLDWKTRPKSFKSYPAAPKVKLSPPGLSPGVSLWESIQKRRSVRNFKNEAIPENALSTLLWASQGVTTKYPEFALRAAPSAGALYPVETYLVVHNVDGLKMGVYHYDVMNHALDELRMEDCREEIARAALDQAFVGACNLVFVWTAVFGRSKWKYKDRAYRYVYLDAGHIAQNVALAAVSLGLGSCQVAALYDDEVNTVVGADGHEESIVYMTAVGKPSGGQE
jgi:SagB-type dehydrogenase family enzyme